MIQVCSVCGTQAAEDTRGGSMTHYLACGCDKKGVWINDGRGGYWQPTNGATTVPLEEFLKKK